MEVAIAIVSLEKGKKFFREEYGWILPFEVTYTIGKNQFSVSGDISKTDGLCVNISQLDGAMVAYWNAGILNLRGKDRQKYRATFSQILTKLILKTGIRALK